MPKMNVMAAKGAARRDHLGHLIEHVCVLIRLL
jgi:hypothetical protein